MPILRKLETRMSLINFHGYDHIETTGRTSSCLTVGATVGGAIGTPLLLSLVALLLMTSMCVIKRKFDSSKPENEIITRRNEVYGEIRIILMSHIICQC